MTSEYETIEAKLFYTADPAQAFAALGACVVEAFAKTDVEAKPRLATATDLAFAVGGLTLTVARTTRPLDIAQYENANRPEAAATPLVAVQGRLNRHRTAVAIRVTGPTKAARQDTRLALCYIAAMQMLALQQPDLVYWARSATLYTIEEFRSSTGAHKPIRPRPAAAVLPARPAGAQPRRQPRAEWMAGSATAEVLPELDDQIQRVHTMRPTAFSHDRTRAHAASRPGSRLFGAASRGAVMAMTAPASAGLFLQQLLPGFKL